MSHRKINLNKRILRGSYINEYRVEYLNEQNYILLKKECHRKGILFEDPLFPLNNKSLFYSKPMPRGGVRWLRPGQIVNRNQKPKFIVNEACADDLDQGTLGNCWLIAGMIAITYNNFMFKKVVPMYQTFEEKDYAGIFHFRFWIYGIWHDVVVDDLLPCNEYGQLLFCHNREEPNEFWAALLEKAYAKICGSCYENLEGGLTSDALIDMSGGIEETLLLDKKNDNREKTRIWKIISRSRELKSMSGAYIESDVNDPTDFRLSNGLVKGHAYSITKIASIYSSSGIETRLIRLRNPWGNLEWNGRWSDNSREWRYLTEQEKTNLEYKNINEGEFYMSFDDFYANFDKIQFCHLSPDSFSEEILKQDHDNLISWKLVAYHDEWVRGVSAGGCGNEGDKLFWTNPQFSIRLIEADKNDKKCTIIVSLLQKYTRQKRFQTNGQPAEDFIQFRLFHIRNAQDADEAAQTGKKLMPDQLERVDNSGDYVNRRDVVKRFRLPLGDYLIIPSIYEAHKEGKFLLRIFSEQKIRRNNMHILNEHNVVINSIEINQNQSPNTDTDIKYDNQLDNVKISVRRQFASSSKVPIENEAKKIAIESIDHFYSNKKHLLAYFYSR